MRRWLLLVMVLLLPLRGWAGDLMSIQMALASSPAQALVAMPADCPMHAGAPAADAQGDSEVAAHGPGMESCSSCELCVPMAKLPDNDVELPHPAAHQPPLMPAVSFASAALAPRVEPPIS